MKGNMATIGSGALAAAIAARPVALGSLPAARAAGFMPFVQLGGPAPMPSGPRVPKKTSLERRRERIAAGKLAVRDGKLVGA